jgi:hypothetical protein
LLFGGRRCRLLDLMDGLGISGTYGQDAGKARVREHGYLRFRSPREYVSGQGFGVLQSAARQQRLDEFAGHRVANWIAGVGEFQRPLQQVDRRSRGPRHGGAGGPSQPGHGFCVAGLRTEGDVAGHLVDRRTRATESGADFSVQPLADR